MGNRTFFSLDMITILIATWSHHPIAVVPRVAIPIHPASRRPRIVILHETKLEDRWMYIYQRDLISIRYFLKRL